MRYPFKYFVNLLLVFAVVVPTVLRAQEETRTPTEADSVILPLDDLATKLELGWPVTKVLSELNGRYKVRDTFMAEKLDVKGREVIQAIRFAPVLFYGRTGFLGVNFDQKGLAKAYLWVHSTYTSESVIDLLDRAGISDEMQDNDTLKDFARIVTALSSSLGKPKHLSDDSQEVAIWKKNGRQISTGLKEGALSFLICKQ